MDPADLLIRYGGPFAPGVVKSASGSFLELEDGSRWFTLARAVQRLRAQGVHL